MIDDALVIFSMLCLVASTITITVNAPTMFIIEGVQLKQAPKPTNFEHLSDNFFKSQWAVAYCFFTGIWAVKGAFLAFYDGLTKRLPMYRRAWWVAIGLTIATYIGSLFAYAFLDGLHFRKSLQNRAVKYQFSADVVTDVFSRSPVCFLVRRMTLTYHLPVTAIPLTLALRSQIPRKQKLALAGVFSLTLIITIFSIIRFVMVSPDRTTAGPSWLQAWSAIEQSVAIIIASFASFRILIVNKARASEGTSSSKGRKYINSFSARKKKGSSDDSGFSHLQSGDEAVSHEQIDLELMGGAHESNSTELGSFEAENGGVPASATVVYPNKNVI